jgi:hypothetical protein
MGPARPPRIGFGLGAASALWLASASAWAAPASCEKENASTFLGYRLYEENDSIIRDGGDERYTQALRVEIPFRRSQTPCWAREVDDWLKHLWQSQKWQKGDFALMLGQNLYTPRIITSVDVDPGDRSF